jgi:hypothetical protein
MRRVLDYERATPARSLAAAIALLTPGRISLDRLFASRRRKP